VRTGSSDHDAVVIAEHPLFRYIPGALAAVIKGDGEAARNGMGDCAFRSQVCQRAAAYISHRLGSVDNNGFVIPDAGDLQVLNADANGGAGIFPVLAYGQCNDNDSGTGAVA